MSLSLWISFMHVGWRRIKLYMKGMIATEAAGGAERESRARRLINEATRLAGSNLQIAS